MGWGKRLRRRLRRIRDSAIDVVKKVPQAGIDVVRGKKALDDAVKESVRVGLRVFESSAQALAEVDRVSQELTVKVAHKVGGEKAATIVADLNRLARLPADPALSVAIIQSVDAFVETGDLQLLNPINIYAVREITDTRERLWDRAHPVPPTVVAALPEGARALANGVRWILEADVPGDLHLPGRAIHHAGASAITLVDLIVFKRLPGHELIDDLFLWIHELYHVHQYTELGAETFTARYLGEELGFRAVGQHDNSMEMTADLFACTYFSNGSPKYLPGGVCPASTTGAIANLDRDDDDDDDTPDDVWLRNLE